MSIKSVHPEYASAASQWERCRDAAAGEDAIKSKTTLYLPMLSGAEQGEYSSYIQRALFYNATGRTIDGMTGAIFMKDPTVDLTGQLKSAKDLDKFVKGSDSFVTLARKAVREICVVSRAGLLVDSAEKEGGIPYICMYSAEDIRNWEEELIDGDIVLTRLILRENKYESKPEDPTGLEKELVVYYRELFLEETEEGYVYKGRLWRPSVNQNGERDIEKYLPGTTYTPTKLGGKTLNRIPFVFMNVLGNTPSVSKPVILDLVNVNISHYRTSADLEHGRHFTALPTPYACGFDVSRGQTLKIGSTTAWIADSPDANAGFLEFTGSGLTSLSDALIEKAKQMAVLGARLLEEQKADAEAAETVRLRQSGESGILSSIARSVSEALTFCVEIVIDWAGLTSECKVQLNTDYFTPTPDPQLFNILFESYQSGAISWDTWFYNLKKHDIAPPGVDGNEERTRIDIAPMSLPSNSAENIQELDGEV